MNNNQNENAEKSNKINRSGFSILNKTKDNSDFTKALIDVKVPLLVLDEKWHHLFEGLGKTKEIKNAEDNLNELLKRQGKLNSDLKDLKKLKNTLMNSIMDDMDYDSSSDKALRDRKMNENKRLIDEINEKMDNIEDELLDLPRALDEANKLLMIYSMDFCYRKLRSNAVEIQEIGSWIKKIRVELKKNIIIKQFNEDKNEEIYTYMHNILGPDAMDVFDLKYEEDGEVID